MPQQQVKPTLIALVVCDNIYQELGGKTALVGLFNSIRASTFPVRHPKMAIFASVTGVRKESTEKLEIVNAETEHVVASADGPFPDNVDPIAVVDMHFILQNVLFPEEGRYFIRLWGNEHLLVMRPFDVLKIQKPEAKQ